MRHNLENKPESSPERFNCDRLTGLPDKTLFFDKLTNALKKAQKKGHFLAVLFLCMNNLKLINDTSGHEIGDMVLKSVAEKLKSCLRSSDTIARPGRDEFMILLPEIAEAEYATLVYEKILETFNSPFILDRNEIFVTFNTGISIYPHDCDNAGTLIKNAYTAMLMAREYGENTHKFYSRDMSELAFEKMRTENNLRLALKRQEFILHYQPLIDLNSGMIAGIEALVRWRHPDRGIIYPDEFINLAEKNGLIIPLGDWVMHTACRQARELQKAGIMPLRIAINLSARQFQQQNLLEKIASILKETGLHPDCLELELTESILIRNEETTMETLISLREMGIQISIDDFGTGYSSLYYLKHLPINSLKIAQSFVSSITTSPDDAAIARAIIALAHNLNLDVVAEGVSKTEQLEFLRQLKCDKVQGYLFSHPLPVEDLTKMLMEKSNQEMLIRNY